jgi:hypothetical protein
MIIAIFGNVITSFVVRRGARRQPLLQFLEGIPAALWFVLSQLALMAFAAMPWAWRSFRTPAGSTVKTPGLRNSIYAQISDTTGKLGTPRGITL